MGCRLMMCGIKRKVTLNEGHDRFLIFSQSSSAKRGRDIGGVAIHAAARVMAQCRSSEVLVSRVVTDLVAGAGLKFSERGSHELKGIPGRWDLFAATV